MRRLTRRYLQDILHYSPETGLFTWQRGRSGIRIGMTAGKKNQKSQIQITIDGRAYLASRLAVFWMTGRWPRKQVDHRNVDPSNNRWKNIRRATNGQNCGNQRRPSNNTTGFKGVSRAASGRFHAGIRKNYRRIHLGTFDTGAKAHAAYRRAARKLFGRFARYQ